MRLAYLAYVPSLTAKIQIFFAAGKFDTLKAKAERFPTRLALEEAMRAAYKAGTISKAEMDAWRWLEIKA